MKLNKEYVLKNTPLVLEAIGLTHESFDLSQVVDSGLLSDLLIKHGYRAPYHYVHRRGNFGYIFRPPNGGTPAEGPIEVVLEIAARYQCERLEKSLQNQMAEAYGLND